MHQPHNAPPHRPTPGSLSAAPNVDTRNSSRHIIVPIPLAHRLWHYFLIYKQTLGCMRHNVEMTGVYGREEALNVIRAGNRDYCTDFLAFTHLALISAAFNLDHALG